VLGTYSIRIKLSDKIVGYIRKITKTNCGYRYEITKSIEKALTYKVHKRCLNNIDNLINKRYITSNKEHIFECYEITTAVLRKEKLKKLKTL
jgi:hypothetical protein